MKMSGKKKDLYGKFLPVLDSVINSVPSKKKHASVAEIAQQPSSPAAQQPSSPARKTKPKNIH